MLRLAVLLTLLLAAPAGAASIRIRPAFCPKGCFDSGGIEYYGAPGEANDLTVTPGKDHVVFDDVVPISAPASVCTNLDPTKVSCVAVAPYGITVDLGDGDDRAVVPFYAPVQGGPGNDDLTGNVLLGGDGDDRLTGTADGDTLAGGPGDDTLAGGGGGDRLVPGEGADEVDGGAGEDTYDAQAAASLTIDLVAGTTGDGDTVTGIEDVDGSQGADVITGDGAANTLIGGLGDDTVRGGGGDDLVEGGGGSDTVDGDAGNDRVDGFGPVDDRLYYDSPSADRADTLDGGPGFDTLQGDRGADHAVCGDDRDQMHAGRGDRLDADCEIVYFGETFCLALDTHRLSPDVLGLSNFCRFTTRRPHSLALYDATGATRLASVYARPARKRIRFALTDAGRAALVPGAVVAVRIAVNPTAKHPPSGAALVSLAL